MSVVAAPVSSSTVVVAVDVGKNCVALSVTDANRHRLFGPVEFAMTRRALDRVVARIGAVLPAAGVVKVGVEAAGHYHLPMITGSAWPAGWEVMTGGVTGTRLIEVLETPAALLTTRV